MAAILNSAILDWANFHIIKLHSFLLTQLDDGSHLEFCQFGLPSWIQTPCYPFSDSLKNTLTPLWHWFKLIQSDSNSFIPTEPDDGSHLEFSHLEFGHFGNSHLSFSSQSHSHLLRLVATICTKKLHSFILTQLDDGSHLEFCHVGSRQFHLGFRHLVIFFQIHSKTLSLHSNPDSN